MIKLEKRQETVNDEPQDIRFALVLRGKDGRWIDEIGFSEPEARELYEKLGEVLQINK